MLCFGNWFPWLSGLGSCVICKHYVTPLCEILNCFSVRICAGIWPQLSGAGEKQVWTVCQSRFWSHWSLRKLHLTCFLGVYCRYKHDFLPRKVQYKASLVAMHISPLHHSSLILVAHCQFDSFMGLSIIWKTFCSYQVRKKNRTKKQKKQKRSKCLEMAVGLHLLSLKFFHNLFGML